MEGNFLNKKYACVDFFIVLLHPISRTNIKILLGMAKRYKKTIIPLPLTPLVGILKISKICI